MFPRSPVNPKSGLERKSPIGRWRRELGTLELETHETRDVGDGAGNSTGRRGPGTPAGKLSSEAEGGRRICGLPNPRIDAPPPTAGGPSRFSAT
ncbi:Hypothetical protein NTJ_09611 [Nesidiocoris tenuis]|uniref:Uncharacterized protein n=1 Tax=Nesidiocoris tenuis TaxID=355587 RepID=A0ABN7AZG9_9HEMI|nr:Hypothetical protein NTJ_09611 [Nesidiocoris tenuis]